MNSTDVFDCTTEDVSIRECLSCREPAAGNVVSSEVHLVCPYCSAEETVPSHSNHVRSSEQALPYRGHTRRPKSTLDLAVPPVGFKGTEARATLWKAWRGTHIRAGVQGEDAYRLVWLACRLGAIFLRSNEPIRVRAVLETALTCIEEPAYRALLLVRLARAAAIAKAPGLASMWLALVSPDLKAPEIDTELRATSALMAREAGRPQDMLTILDQGESKRPFAGAVRHLVTALRTDALEQLGRETEAEATWRAAALSGAASFAALYKLAPKTRARALRRAVILVPILLVIVCGLFLAIAALLKSLFALSNAATMSLLFAVVLFTFVIAGWIVVLRSRRA